MDRIIISMDSKAEDLTSLALCVHTLTGGMPVTARSRNYPGVQIEEGRVRSKVYTGPILEQALAENRMIKGKPREGDYKGIPVTVAPILLNGLAIAAIGVVDTTGALDFKAQMDQYARLEKQVGR
ncbi:MAG TPA: DUF2111 domain-containing protein [Methanocella sp.]|nr:DUF2111 domain-containing protein [Methanocella sp.]